MAQKIPRTRKAIEKRLKEIGGAHNSEYGRKLARRFNDIAVKERVNKHGLSSLNPYDPANARFLRRLKRRR